MSDYTVRASAAAYDLVAGKLELELPGWARVVRVR